MIKLKAEIVQIDCTEFKGQEPICTACLTLTSFPVGHPPDLKLYVRIPYDLRDQIKIGQILEGELT